MDAYDPRDPAEMRQRRREQRLRRRLRMRRHGRRAYIRSVYFLPSLATLSAAVSGFGAVYVAALVFPGNLPQRDPWTDFLQQHGFTAAAYLIFLAMVFDAVDGRLARFTRHTTDFGGQLDSLADVISFGFAPAFLSLRVFHIDAPDLGITVSRLVWAIGALYMGCAAIRLARFNVSNEHGEQYHFSFLGLPSPGAAAAVAGVVLMEQDLAHQNIRFLHGLSTTAASILPVVVLAAGLLMVSHVRYPHLVNRYLKGRRSIGRLILVMSVLLLMVVAHQYTIGIGSLVFAGMGPVVWASSRMRRNIRTTPR